MVAHGIGIVGATIRSGVMIPIGATHGAIIPRGRGVGARVGTLAGRGAGEASALSGAVRVGDTGVPVPDGAGAEVPDGIIPVDSVMAMFTITTLHREHLRPTAHIVVRQMKCVTTCWDVIWAMEQPTVHR